MTDDTYEIVALKYAWVHRSSSENFLGGDSHDVPMPMDYYVWVIRNEARTFLLDTGFDRQAADARKRTLTTPVADGLKMLGVDHEHIETVLISHLHYDHAGNRTLFPKARFHIQECEMSFATGRCMCHQQIRVNYDVEDIVEMVRRNFAGRVEFYAGDTDFAPGITLHKLGGHSAGMQVVRVKTRRGYVVLASDAAHYYAHLDRKLAFPALHDLADLLEGYKALHRLATSPEHIIPGHDPLVLTRYPAAGPGLEGIAVRVDAEPISP